MRLPTLAILCAMVPAVAVEQGTDGSIRVVARDASGAETWSYPADGTSLHRAPRIARDEDHVVLGFVHQGVIALDARTGAETFRRSFALTLSGPGITIADGTAYLAEAKDYRSTGSALDQNDLNKSIITAIDLSSGALKWRRDDDLYVDGQLTPEGSSLLTYATDGAEVIALDRATGSLAWRWGAADGSTPHITSRTKVEHVTIVGRVFVDGKLKPDVRVSVADLEVTTDAHGAFRASLDLSGGAVLVFADDTDIPIAVEGRRDGGVNEPVIIPLTGRGTYRADIHTISAPGGG
jgi:outer membrane protein assembly factor BamB